MEAERACLAGLAGGCLAPVGAWARFEGDRLHLGACVLGPDGDGIKRIVSRGVAEAAESPDRLGRRVAEALRGLPIAVIGRIEDGQVRLDLRGLDGAEAEQAFVAQLPQLALARF